MFRQVSNFGDIAEVVTAVLIEIRAIGIDCVLIDFTKIKAGTAEVVQCQTEAANPRKEIDKSKYRLLCLHFFELFQQVDFRIRWWFYFQKLSVDAVAVLIAQQIDFLYEIGISACAADEIPKLIANQD